jgi:glycosyltransferase involved in cell wall biosynthesis
MVAMDSESGHLQETIPTVSVIMPVYNGECFLREAIDSVRSQTFTDWELILVDDASTDNSATIAREYAARDSRIHFFANEVNLGVAQTRNRALAAARGLYIAPLDNDDAALPSRLAEQVRFLEDNPEVGLVGSSLQIMDEDSLVVATRVYPCSDQEIRACLLRMNPIANPASMFRMSIFVELGGYDESVCPVEDYDFVMRVAGCCKIANLRQPLTRYRMSPGQAKSVYLKKTLRMTLFIQRKALEGGARDSLRNRLYRLGLKGLLLLPDRLVMWLFRQVAFSSA